MSSDRRTQAPNYCCPPSDTRWCWWDTGHENSGRSRLAAQDTEALAIGFRTAFSWLDNLLPNLRAPASRSLRPDEDIRPQRKAPVAQFDCWQGTLPRARTSSQLRKECKIIVNEENIA